MHFAFDDEQKMLRDVLRGNLNRSIPTSRIREWVESGDLSPFDQFAAEAGWPGLGTPEKDGGQGGGLVELSIFFEEIGRAAAPSDLLLSTIGLGLPMVGSLRGGLEKLSEVLEGTAGLALMSPVGMPFDASRRGVEVQDTRLSGHVPLVLSAPTAKFLLVPVAVGYAVDLWLVNTSEEGVTILPRHAVDRTRRYGAVTLTRAGGKLLGRISDQAATALTAHCAVLIAAESLGLARRMLEMTTQYVSERIQFGVPVGSFQAVKHAAAEALVDIEAVHSGVYYAAWALENNAGDALAHAWMAKAFATEIAARTADRALFLHGAIGYTWEYDLQFYYKRAKANVELFGSPRTYRDRIADAIRLV